MSNYMPVLNIVHEIDRDPEDQIEETFPEHWQDPLELCGRCLRPLDLTETGMNDLRVDIILMLRDHSPKWIWENRCRLVAETIYIRDYF
jgi:hypothetical protein